MSITKGRGIMTKDKSSRSYTLSQKTKIGQQRRSPNPPSTLERKKALASTDCIKVPIYYKPTVCSILHSRNPMKQPFFDTTKLLPQSNVMYEKNVSSSYMKTVGSAKPKDVGKTRLPLNLKNVGSKKQTRQPTNELESKKVCVEKKPRLCDVTHVEDDKTIPIVSKDILAYEDYNKQHLDHEDGVLNNVVEYEYGGKSPLCEPLVTINLGEDQYMVELDTCFDQDNVTLNESTYIEDIDDDHGCDINQQVQAGGILHLHEVEQEARELENEQVVKEAKFRLKDVENAKSKDLEHEEMERKELGHEEPKPKEVEIKEGSEEVPKEEDQTSEVLAENRKVVAHGKKDTAAYNYVKEETACKIPEQRGNKVKALVGAFETVISRKSHALQR